MKPAHSTTFQIRTSALLAAGFIVLGFSADPALALPITKTLTLDVFVVCNTDGTNCASTGPAGDAYFAAEANKIWAQAGISVGFNFVQNINDSNFTAINDNVVGKRFCDLAGTCAPLSPSSTNVDLFLTHSVNSVGGAVYGEGYFGYGGIVIGMDLVMAYNGGLGRIDTIAHELGHNLGLVPEGALGGDAGGHSPGHPNYLMADGVSRTVPATLADIAPSGLGLDFLPTDQINLARQSSLLHGVPEPASYALFALGLLGMAAGRRRVAAS
jgi:hypothetical protein